MIFKLFTDEWADKKSPAQVDAFLHGYKYRWYKVVPQLVAFDPSKRPTKFSDLIGLLDREPAPVAAAKPKVAPSKKRMHRVTVLAGLLRPVMTAGALTNLSLIGSVLIFCVGVNLVWDRGLKVGEGGAGQEAR